MAALFPILEVATIAMFFIAVGALIAYAAWVPPRPSQHLFARGRLRRKART